MEKTVNKVEGLCIGFKKMMIYCITAQSAHRFEKVKTTYPQVKYDHKN